MKFNLPFNSKKKPNSFDDDPIIYKTVELAFHEEIIYLSHRKECKRCLDSYSVMEKILKTSAKAHIHKI